MNPYTLFFWGIGFAVAGAIPYWMMVTRLQQTGEPVRYRATIWEAQRSQFRYLKLARERGWPTWPFWTAQAAFGIFILLALASLYVRVGAK